MFRRPAFILSKVLHKVRNITGHSISFDLIDLTIVFYYYVMFHPQGMIMKMEVEEI